MAMIPFVHEKMTVAVSRSKGLPSRRSADAGPEVDDRPAVDVHGARRAEIVALVEVAPELVHDRAVAVIDVAVHGDPGTRLVRVAHAGAPLPIGIAPVSPSPSPEAGR